jgi:hypothetical protein
MYKNTGTLSIANMMKYMLSSMPSTCMKKEINLAMIINRMGAMRNRLNKGESIFFYLSRRVKIHKYIIYFIFVYYHFITKSHSL